MHKIEKSIHDMKAKCPLVHNITNFVVMQISANSLLAIGASPVMSHEKEEFEDMISISSSLVLNIGTLDKNNIVAMEVAGAIAARKNVPVVLDPVGAGATKLRTLTALNLLKTVKPQILRCNASEIMALAGVSSATKATKGVDSTLSVKEAVEGAKYVARTYKTVVSVSGEVDMITDGLKTFFVRGGSKLMPLVTGMGCSASAISGAMVAVSEPLTAATAAMAIMDSAGEAAGRIAKGPGSFIPAFLDALYFLNIEDTISRVIEEK